MPNLVISRSTAVDPRWKPSSPFIIRGIPEDTILWPMHAPTQRFQGQYRDARFKPNFDSGKTAGVSFEVGVNGYGLEIATARSTNALVFDPAQWTQAGVTDITYVGIYRPTRAWSSYPSTNEFGAFSWDDGAVNSQGVKLFAKHGGGTFARWRIAEAAGNLDVVPSWSAGDLIVMVGRLGNGTQNLDILNLSSGATYSGSSATSASITLPNVEIVIGNTDFSSPKNVSWDTKMLGSSFTIGRRWVDAEVQALRFNPFWWNKPQDGLIMSEIAAAPPTGSAPVYLFHNRHHNRSA